MAAAFIRVKRHLDEEPSDAIILSCKRRKIESQVTEGQDEFSAVLKFAGTLKSQDADISTYLKKPSKQDLEQHFKKHSIDLNSKLRSQKQHDAKISRYKIVNCLRSTATGTDTEAQATSNSEYTVYDIETASKDLSKEDDSRDKYVYDVYYTMSDDLGDAYLEDYVNMYHWGDGLMFGSMRDNGVDKADSEEDSEDSNAEGFWKNDYPDESDNDSILEQDMVNAMTKCDLNDLSSDEGEEGFVYSIDSEAAGFEEDVDESDVQRYGERYARFKAKHKQNVTTTTLNPDLYYGDIDEEEYYY